jgi:uncharacterized membrane protein
MTLNNRVTAVFENYAQAEQAVQALRSQGVRDDHLSVVSQQNASGATANANQGHAHGDDAGEGASKGLLAGAGVGALFGIAAALIPGVGPFITAGTLLSSALGAVGGGAVAGALVGGTTGAIAGALARSGYDEHEARYYGSAVEQGGILVAVDVVDGLSSDQVRATLSQYGARYFQAASA